MEVNCHRIIVEEIYELQKKKQREESSKTKSSVVIEEILDDGKVLHNRQQHLVTAKRR